MRDIDTILNQAFKASFWKYLEEKYNGVADETNQSTSSSR